MIVLLVLLAIIALIGITTMTIMRRGCDKESNYEKRLFKRFGFIRTLFIIIPLAIAILAMLIAGIRIMDQTQIGVVKTFGRVDHTISGGFNMVNPISDTVEIMDLTVHVKEASFASYTKDAQPVTATVEYQYEPIGAQAMAIVTQYGSYEIMESKLAAAAEERAKIVLARYSAMPLLETRSTLSAQVWEEIAELEATFPVKFTNVVVKDLDFSDAFEAAVEAKMQAEQNALRAENEKKEAVTRAEQAKEVAAIEAEAAIAKAQGEAEALKITREALEQMPETWVAQLYLEKWDGKLPSFMSGDSGSTSLMITPDLG